MGDPSDEQGEASGGDAYLADHRAQNLYFRELFQLRVACEYARHYKDVLTWWVTRIGAIRAITSSGAIAAWAVFQKYPILWAGLIAATQVADALKDVFPFGARQKAVTALGMSLDALFVEILYEWEGVFAGKFTAEEISSHRRRLMERRLELDKKHFPTGDLPLRSDLLALAEQDATAYLEDMFGNGANE